ncbi:MAG: hypothetical protein PWQ25_1061 [Deferribacteres bacterium]|jgi:drug/metabolite transporter (DMT)-like permease|nr:hypothetical protein [Deferribacteres bacterium]
MSTGIIYALLSATCFAFLAIFAKLGYNMDISTSNMLFYRFFFASLIFAIYFALKNPKLFVIKRINLLKAMFAGSILYFLQSNLFFLAIKNTSVSTASLILYLYPLFVTILSVFIYKQKLNNVTIFSLIFIAIGSCLIFYNAFYNRYSLTGIAFALGASMVFSCYIIFIQYSLKTQKPLTFSFYVMLFAALSFSLKADFSFKFDKNAILLITGLSFISTFLAITLLYLSIEKIGSMYASIFSSIEPVITVIASGLILSEKVDYIQISGMALILISIMLPQIKKIEFANYEQKIT